MSYEFMLPMRTAAAKPLEDSLEQVARLLGGNVETNEKGVRRVHKDRLLVDAMEPDELDRENILRTFNLDSNLTLIFEDLSQAGPEVMIRVHQSLMRVVLGMAEHAAAGVLLENDYSPSAIVLEFDGGHVTLNRDWDGWELWPEVLNVFPEPRQFRRLRGRA